MVALYVHFTWCIKCRCVANAYPINNYIVYLIIWIILIPYTKMEFFSISRRLAQCPTKACTLLSIPRKQSSWGQYGAHLGPVGPRWAPFWPHESCYQGTAWTSVGNHHGHKVHRLRALMVVFVIQQLACILGSTQYKNRISGFMISIIWSDGLIVPRCPGLCPG